MTLSHLTWPLPTTMAQIKGFSGDRGPVGAMVATCKHETSIRMIHLSAGRLANGLFPASRPRAHPEFSLNSLPLARSLARSLLESNARAPFLVLPDARFSRPLPPSQIIIMGPLGSHWNSPRRRRRIAD